VPDLRIVSLLSSATEIVHALGLGGFQVGRSHECDYPPCVLELPVCSRPAFPVNGSSVEIDQLVKSRLASALSIYEVDAARIRQLRPTHILTQTQCKVCAVSLEDVERDLRDSLGAEARLVSLEPYELADLWRDIERVASACGVPESGSRLNARLQNEMHSIAQTASRARSRPRVAAIEWIEPLMAAGNWVPQLIEMAGATNLFGQAGAHSPWMSWDQLRAADPDVIIVLPCGFDLARAQSEMHWLTDRQDWGQLRAVRSKNVYLCDGNQYMNRPGPRLAESLRIFAEIFHPALFPQQFGGTGWLPFLTPLDRARS
jgi:iron complex transport system substrate-binding protein